MMNPPPLLVTCGLPYTNGPCHLGHLRTYVPADMYVRYMRRAGEEVVFVCGSDNHGTPIVVSAEEQGISPRALSEKYHKHFDETFKRMNVLFDRFGMTDDAANHHRTQAIVAELEKKGYIYKQTVHQAYCTKCKRFLPDRYVEGTCPHCGKPARGDECDQGCGKHLEPGEIKDPVCKVCGTKAEFRDQEHFFFKLSEFKDFLLPYLDTLRGTSNAKNYAIGWIKDELHDWCITRTLEWGVKFPGRDDLVVYVWVDAPIGYIAFTEEWAKANGKDWKGYWCGENRVTHFIGGDIIYHHCIFWPALLKGAGYGVPHAVVASGMVKVDDHKFSKSRGYVVWTNDDYLDKGLPADYLRYYLLAYTSHTKELNFSWKVFGERINNEVVNIFGNFVYRTLYFAQKEFEGIPAGTVDPVIMAEIEKTLATVDQFMRDYEFKGAVDAIMMLAAFGNTYIQTNAPWKLIKTDRAAAAQVIRNCIQIAKALAILIEAAGDAGYCPAVLDRARVLRQGRSPPDQRCHPPGPGGVHQAAHPPLCQDGRHPDCRARRPAPETCGRCQQEIGEDTRGHIRGIPETGHQDWKGPVSRTGTEIEQAPETDGRHRHRAAPDRCRHAAVLQAR